MTEYELSTFENFLLNSKQGVLDKMIKGTDIFNYFKYLQILSEPQLDLNEEHRAELKQYSKFQTENSKNIQLRILFKSYDHLTKENNEVERKKVLDEINDLLFKIKFNHGQPPSVQSAGSLLSQKQQNSSVFDENLLDIQDYLRKALKTLIDFQKIGPQFYSLIDLNELAQLKELDVISYFLNGAQQQLSSFKELPLFLHKYSQRKLLIDKHFTLDQNIFKNCSLDQMNELIKLIPDFNTNSNFIGELFMKKFPYQRYDRTTLNQDHKEKEIQTKRLNEIYQWTKQLPPIFQSLSDQILYELLQIGVDTNEYNFDFFLMYLKNPKTTYSNASLMQQKNLSSRTRPYQSNWHNFNGIDTNQWIFEDTLVKKYLEKYFEVNEDIKIFNEFLDEKFLLKILNQVKLYKGDDILNITEQFSGPQLKSMNDEKLINICSFNKQWFESGEQVKMYVEIKNVSQLTVKVFEFCSENYYLKNWKEIDGQINLDGLIASEQSDFNYNEKPIVKSIKELTFETITKKDRGVFIIELIGNGLSSRAIIKKGKLVLKEKLTVAGHAIQILDEQLNQCSGQRTGLWLDGQFHKVDEMTKEIVIPFSQDQRNYPVVIVHEDFACLSNMEVKNENYSFLCAFIYSNESMLMSSKAKVLIQPRLYINNVAATLKLLSDPQVQVTSTSDTGIPSTTTFDKITLNSNEEIEIEFPISAKVRSIDIVVTSSLQKLNSQQDKDQEVKQTNKQTLSQSHNISFNNFNGQQVFCSQFLQYTSDQGYVIYLLGKNGEPKQGVEIEIILSIDGIETSISSTLSTDHQGKVVLGSLRGVRDFASRVLNLGDINAEPTQWGITNNYKIKYQNDIQAVSGDTIKLQFMNKQISNQTVQFFKQSFDKNKNYTIIQNLQDKLQLKEGYLIIPDLEKGNYVLSLMNPFKQINIEVIEGQYWKQNLIVTKDSLFSANQSYQQLFLKEVNQTVDGDKVKVKAQFVTPNIQNTRVHAIAVQFIVPGQIDELASRLQQNTIEAPKVSIDLQKQRNSYFNNKRLSDEQKYVLDRRNQERYIGNTLEKPQILLKRQFLRDTTMNNEVLNQEGDFQAMNYTSHDLQRREVMQEKCMASNYFDSCVQETFVNSFLNFLLKPALVMGNYKLSDDGFVEFDIPSSYSTVFLVATNNSETTLEAVPLKRNEIKTRNLTQNSSLDKNKFYSIFRNNKIIDEKETINIPDLTSTELQIVDSIPKIFKLLKELRKCNNEDREQEGGFEYWEILQRWERLEIDEKNKQFEKLQCDELNLFIFFKDRAYFETYVKNYITNKIEKSFIDYFLLMNNNKMIEFSSAQNLQKLNSMEKALLVIYFAELSSVKEDHQIALEVAGFLENQIKLNAVDQRLYKQLFDTVLEAKNAEGQQDEQQMESDSVSFAAFTNFGASQPRVMMMQQHMEQKKTMAQPQRRMMKKCAAPSPPQQEMEEEDRYLKMREQYKQEFKNLEKTKEYGEKHYANAKSLDKGKNRVKINGFWVDLAKHSLEHGVFNKNFLSQKFIYCNNNHTEMIAVIALIGLPFETPNHKYTPFEGKGVSIQAANTSLVFTKEIKEGKADLKVDILIAQRFFDPKNRYVYSDEDPTLQEEKTLSEYIVNKIYGCQVIITNCSIQKNDFQVLVEVPSGSIPVNTVDYTKSYTITLESYTTKTIEYFFYFPQSGKFDVYPANVARTGTVVAVAKEVHFEVNNELKKTNLETMDEILSKGSKADILNFVASKNIQNPKIFSFNDIYYLLKDQQFYLELIRILRQKKIFDYTTWTYSIYHADHQSLKEFFNYDDNVVQKIKVFKYFKCSLFEVGLIRFTEYYPLISQRVHQLSQDRSNILNVQFKEQYINFIRYLVEKHTLDLTDKLVFVYYLLLQERINEAIKIYQSINSESIPEQGESRLQYDYFTAYLDFYIGYPNFIQARKICEKYLDYPVIHWRNLFYEVVNQLTEYDGEDMVQTENKSVQVDNTKSRNKEAADKQETLSMEIEGKKINLTHTNVKEVTVQIFKIDLEVLFSRNPFVSQGGEDFAYVQPNYKFNHKTVYDPSSVGLTSKTSIDIPEEFTKTNVFILINSVIQKVQSTYFSTSLQVTIIENYGQVKVQDQNGKPLSKVYIKVFAQQNDGAVIFYKDGYTDLRGRLDYASLNADSLKNVKKFAIFVMSDELGSLINEVKAPSTVGKYEQEVQLISTQWAQKADIQKQSYGTSYGLNKKLFSRK